MFVSRNAHRPVSAPVRLVLVLLALLCSAGRVSAAEPEGGWRPVEWLGGEAWESASGGWLAIVSAPRGRLVHFGPAGERALNLLHAPAKLEGEPVRGGHRAWLGPQGDWASPWPPPKDWEESPAASVRLGEDGVLVMEMPRTETTYPALVRTYARTTGGGLELGLRWRGTEARGLQAIQILQLPGSAVARLPLQNTPFLPLGYAVLDPDARTLVIPEGMDAPVVERSATGLLLRRSPRMMKVGFTPQLLEADVRGYRLALAPGRMEGRVGDAPDGGLLTQVFFGDLGFELVEIEQLSPRLFPGPDGWCGYHVRLNARLANP